MRIDKFDWNPSSIGKNWMSFCDGFKGLPFISQTLWQVGPMPWILNLGNSNQWFNNGNWGEVEDSFIKNIPDKNSPESEDVKPDGTPKTPEEKAAEKKEAAKKATEIKVALNSYNQMLNRLKGHAKTLTDNEKIEFETLIEGYSSKSYTTNLTKEGVQKDLAELTVIYDEHKEKIIDSAKINALENIISTNDETNAKKAEDLYNAIEIGTSLDAVLDVSTGKLKADVKIMDLISAWNNNTEFGDKAHIMRAIVNRAKVAKSTELSNLEALAKALQGALIKEIEDIENKLDKTSQTKEDLLVAKSHLDRFNKDNRFLQHEEEGKKDAYTNAFDNLYRMIRIAEAEIEDAKLKKDFEFMGEANPYKDGVIKQAVEGDLDKENLRVARDVIDPVVPTAPNEGNVIKHKNKEYKVIEESGTRKYKTGEKILTEEEFYRQTNITNISFNQDGSYTFEAGGVKYKSDKEHNQSRDV